MISSTLVHISIILFSNMSVAHKINDRNHFDLFQKKFLTDNWDYDYRCYSMIYMADEIKEWAGDVVWKDTPLGPSWVAQSEIKIPGSEYCEYVAILGQDSQGRIDLKGFYVLLKKLNFKTGTRCHKMYP